MKRTKSQGWIQQPSAKSQQAFKKPRRTPIGASVGAVPSKNPEKKNIDVLASALAAPGTTWTATTLLNPIAQGTGVNQRVGRQVNLKNLFLRWTYVTGVAGSQGRILIVYDKQPGGAPPATIDILTTNDYNGMMALGNTDRFKILHDELIFTQAQSNQGNLQPTSTIYSGKYFKDFGVGLQNIWSDATTGVIASLATGAVWIMFNSGAVAATLTFNSRIRYTDQ